MFSEHSIRSRKKDGHVYEKKQLEEDATKKASNNNIANKNFRRKLFKLFL
jgi:hypothetical protein